MEVARRPVIVPVVIVLFKLVVKLSNETVIPLIRNALLRFQGLCDPRIESYVLLKNLTLPVLPQTPIDISENKLGNVAIMEECLAEVSFVEEDPIWHLKTGIHEDRPGV
jgi:hypothetical protein